MENLKDILLCALLTNNEKLNRYVDDNHYRESDEIKYSLNADKVSRISAIKFRPYEIKTTLIQKRTWFTKPKYETIKINEHTEDSHYLEYDGAKYPITKTEWDSVVEAYEKGVETKLDRYQSEKINKLKNLCKKN